MSQRKSPKALTKATPLMRIYSNKPNSYTLYFSEVTYLFEEGKEKEIYIERDRLISFYSAFVLCLRFLQIPC